MANGEHLPTTPDPEGAAHSEPLPPETAIVEPTPEPVPDPQPVGDVQAAPVETRGRVREAEGETRARQARGAVQDALAAMMPAPSPRPPEELAETGAERDAANLLADIAGQVRSEGNASILIIRGKINQPRPEPVELGAMSPADKAAQARIDGFAWETMKELVRQGVITSGTAERDEQIVATPLLDDSGWLSGLAGEYLGFGKTLTARPMGVPVMGSFGRPTVRGWSREQYAVSMNAIRTGRPSEEYMEHFADAMDAGITHVDGQVTAPYENVHSVVTAAERLDGAAASLDAARLKPEGRKKPPATVPEILQRLDEFVQREEMEPTVRGSIIHFRRSRALRDRLIGESKLATRSPLGRLAPVSRMTRAVADQLRTALGDDYADKLQKAFERVSERDDLPGSSPRERYAQELILTYLPHLNQSGKTNETSAWRESKVGPKILTQNDMTPRRAMVSNILVAAFRELEGQR